MRTVLFSTFDELTPYAEQWDRINDTSPSGPVLSGSVGPVPFRSWDWSSAWWQYYGEHWHASRRLFVLAVFDGLDNLIGLAPWYIDHSMAFGSVVRFLGSGEVCSDYLDIISQAGRENEVADALADWFAEELGNHVDLVELTAVDAVSSNVEKLASRLNPNVCAMHQRGGDSCWHIDLPANIDDYLIRLSKDGRKAFRRIERRMFDTGRAVLRTAETVDELAESMEILIDLHKRRFFVNGRQTSSCSDHFWNFHRDVAQRLFRAGHVRLHILDIDGMPAAAEYQFSGGSKLYVYQSGIDPDRLDVSPGSVAMTAVLRWAIAEGYHGLDLLRGNEGYKAHWRAKPRKCKEIRIVPGGIAPQLRHTVWLAGTNTYKWLKEGVKQIVPERNE